MAEFQWSPVEPWTFASVASNVSKKRGGGSLQLWRVLDLVHMPEKEAVGELQKYFQEAKKGRKVLVR